MSSGVAWGATIAEVAGLCWALGMASFTAFTFVLWVCHIPYAPAAVCGLLVSCTAAVVLSVVLADKRRNVRGPAGAGILTAAAASLGAGAVGFSYFVAARWPLRSWDAWGEWGFKAQVFARGGPSAHFWHDPAYLFSNPAYPLNVPLAEAPFFFLGRTHGASLAALLGPTFLAALLLTFYAGGTRLYGRGPAALLVVALAALPFLSLHAAAAYADVPMAVYLGGSVLYLLLWWRLREPLDLAIVGFFVGSAAWTKTEGLPFGSLVLAWFFISLALDPAPRRQKLRASLLVLVPSVAIALPWLLFEVIVRPERKDFMAPTLHDVVVHIDRLPTILSYVAQQLLAVDNWGVFWPILFVVLLTATTKRALRGATLGLALLLAALLAFISSLYVLSDLHPYTYHVATSLPRLLVQIVPLAALLLVDASYGLDWSVVPGRAAVKGAAPLDKAPAGDTRNRRLGQPCERFTARVSKRYKLAGAMARAKWIVYSWIPRSR